VSLIVSPYTAGRLFLGLSLVMTIAGVSMLHQALFGRRSLWPLVAAIFVYHQVFLSGFVAYATGVGFSFFFAALWVRIWSWPRVSRVLVGIVIACAIYFVHVLALGLYALFVATLELWRFFADGDRPVTQRLADLVTGAVPFIVPLSLFWLSSDIVNQVVDVAPFTDELPLDPMIPPGTWQAIADRLDQRLTLFVRMIRVGYYVWPNLAILALGCAIVGYAFLQRALRVRWQPVIAAAILAVLLFLIPSSGVFHVVDLPVRFPIVILFLVIAGIDIDPSVRGYAALAGLLIACFVTHTSAVATNFMQYNKELREFRAAFAHVEPGAKVFSTKTDMLPGKVFKIEPTRQLMLTYGTGLHHLQVLMVAERHAFCPYFFAHPEKQILKVRDEYQDLAYNDGGVPTPWSMAMSVLRAPQARHSFLRQDIWKPTKDWWLRYDYLTVIYPHFVTDLPKQDDPLLKLVFAGRWINIYRIQHAEHQGS
jgi:hypothetical protein